MLIENFNELEKLNEEINRLLRIMSEFDDPTDERYVNMADQLTKLMKIKQMIAETTQKDFDAESKRLEFNETLQLKARELLAKERELLTTNALKNREVTLKEEEAAKPDRVSKETLAVIGANLAGIAAILLHERVNVIASKALGFIKNVR